VAEANLTPPSDQPDVDGAARVGGGPPRNRRQPRRRASGGGLSDLVIVPAVLVLGCVLEFVRSPSALLHPQLFGEDGAE
jgi:hypothetical protein